MAEWRAEFLSNHPPGAMGALDLWRSLESTLPLDDDTEEVDDPSEAEDETDDDASEQGDEDEEPAEEDHPEPVAPVNVDTALFDEATQLSGLGGPRLQAPKTVHYVERSGGKGTSMAKHKRSFGIGCYTSASCHCPCCCRCLCP